MCRRWGRHGARPACPVTLAVCCAAYRRVQGKPACPTLTSALEQDTHPKGWPWNSEPPLTAAQRAPGPCNPPPGLDRHWECIECMSNIHSQPARPLDKACRARGVSLPGPCSLAALQHFKGPPLEALPKARAPPAGQGASTQQLRRQSIDTGKRLVGRLDAQRSGRPGVSAPTGPGSRSRAHAGPWSTRRPPAPRRRSAQAAARERAHF